MLMERVKVVIGTVRVARRGDGSVAFRFASNSSTIILIFWTRLGYLFVNKEIEGYLICNNG